MPYARLISAVLVLLFFGQAQAQIKGKARHLEGTWQYPQESGYEVWEMQGDVLTGKGFRSTKVGDSVLVETLRIEMISRNLVYTLETRPTESTVLPLEQGKYQFIGNGRKMDFRNLDNQLPSRITYSFGFLNRKKLKIRLYGEEGSKPVKLKLTRLRK